MVDRQRIGNSILYQELGEEGRKYWFDMKARKFLHNIDTFYYSVKLREDFTADSQDKNVLAFRRAVEKMQNRLAKEAYNGDVQQLFVIGEGVSDYLNIVPRCFSRFYTLCLEMPDMFDIFIAPVVPGGEGCPSVTSEIIVQLRSELLWQLGANAAFEKSFLWVRALCSMYGLTIEEAKENRADFCWHSNYLEKPGEFFSDKNFDAMRCTRLGTKTMYVRKDSGTGGSEFSYLSRGNRGEKTFLRIYNKSMEVVEQGYKSWFLKTWLFHGLINRYDFDVYEQAYLQRSWGYTAIARLKFYLQHGSSAQNRTRCRELIAMYDMCHKVTDTMLALADELTPPLNLIVNVEFQLMRRASKSYDILPLKDNTGKGVAKRIYDFLDNRRLIADYLTGRTFRLVEKTGDSNRSRRPDCGFWASLRRTKMVDAAPVPEGLKMQRIYNRKLNAERMKESIIHKAVTYGMYMKGINNDSPVSDIMLSVLRLNDNDIKAAKRYKERRAKQLNKEALADVMPEQQYDYDLMLVDRNSGLLVEAEEIGGWEEWEDEDGGSVPCVPGGQGDLLRPEDAAELQGTPEEVPRSSGEGRDGRADGG